MLTRCTNEDKPKLKTKTAQVTAVHVPHTPKVIIHDIIHSDTALNRRNLAADDVCNKASLKNTKYTDIYRVAQKK